MTDIAVPDSDLAGDVGVTIPTPGQAVVWSNVDSSATAVLMLTTAQAQALTQQLIAAGFAV